ncbi:hypothetical protein F5051DRAFT_140546 [Lentinula edodes]|nr:hypothetical protein F5051DRAFT_140546 [Lentinula edodes]
MNNESASASGGQLAAHVVIDDPFVLLALIENYLIYTLYTPKLYVAARVSRAILLSFIFVMVYNFVVFCRRLLVLGSLGNQLIEAQIDCVYNEFNFIEEPLFYFIWFPDIRDGVALTITYLCLKVLLY